MTIAGIVFLALFTIDGLFSAVEESFRAATGSFALASSRNSLATLAIVAAFFATILCACSPRLPAKVYLVPLSATFWLAVGALPVPMWIAPTRLSPLLIAIQLGVAGLGWVALSLAVRASGGLRAFDAARARFSVKRLAAFVGAGSIVLPVASAAYGALILANFIENATGNFIEVQSDGMWIADRRYVRDDREVRLVGMMHLGESDSYDELFGSFTGTSTLVLEEGVSDRQGLLRNPLSYGKAASAIGLDAQSSVAEYFDDARRESEGDADVPIWPDVRRADVDVSDFSPSTIAFIERAAELWSSDDPVAALLDVMRDPPPNDELELFFLEIVSMRNAQLLAELERAQLAYRSVIVPWGALHLPGIAHEIEQRGFVLTEETQRPLISWGTILAALFR